MCLHSLGLVGEEDHEPAVGAEGDLRADGFVEGGLPPAAGLQALEGPAETLPIDGLLRRHGEDGHLLPREGGEGAAAGHGREAAVVGEHLDVGTGVLLSKGDEVGDIAQRVVLATAGGPEECVVGSG